LTQEQQRLIWLNYTNFVKEGANLNPEAKEKVAKINGELASYFSTFRIYWQRKTMNTWL
jgi:peptidyl-dipeptidase Dcp